MVARISNHKRQCIEFRIPKDGSDLEREKESYKFYMGKTGSDVERKGSSGRGSVRVSSSGENRFVDTMEARRVGPAEGKEVEDNEVEVEVGGETLRVWLTANLVKGRTTAELGAVNGHAVAELDLVVIRVVDLVLGPVQQRRSLSW